VEASTDSVASGGIAGIVIGLAVFIIIVAFLLVRRRESRVSSVPLQPVVSPTQTFWRDEEESIVRILFA
jgi:hypothetical protein